MTVSHGVGSNGEPQINTVRRSLLLQWFTQRNLSEFGLADASLGALAFIPGTPIPPSTPAYSKLTARNYTMVEDLDGANVDELMQNVPGILRTEAKAALVALGLIAP